jgi:quercetin dioxygenase-like cupin family protein
MLPKPQRIPLVIPAGIILTGLMVAWAQGPSAKPVPKVISIGAGEQEYVRLLAGPPESVTMRSGAVTLQPGKTVGKHNTEGYEEFILVLEGRGSMMLSDGRQLEMTVGSAVYCPPDTEHDVKNTGLTPLRYVYVVAKTR